ncbi:GerMN domain-containing protein [Candidatus Aerophobetes bacterium]|nr:GerMN domain-containing protein [Candidatus Aerophobetes bacterium]
MSKKFFAFIALVVGAFIAGIVFSPFFLGTTYQLKKWVGNISSPTQVSKVITLYFSTPDEQFLVPVKRRIIFDKEQSVNDKVRRVVEELIKGPEKEFLSPTLPQEAKIRAVYIKEDIIYIDFTPSLAKNHPGGTSAELMSVYSIVNTLLENFPSYSRVQILIEGTPHKTLVGHIDIRGPFKKNTEIIKKSM